MATLNFLEKKLSNRISSWKNKYLSQSGKETMLKAVAIALPIYAMSCFRLPKQLTRHFTSQMANFWWRNQLTNKGIHWNSWEKLTKHKKNGGLGFRDLEGFNQALLGKQLWRIASSKDSLIAQVLKSRYYPNSNILEAKVGNRPSYAWRSIHSALPLMKSGMKREFGDGTHIDILKDPWIVDPLPRPPKLRDGIDPASVSIGVLKHFSSDEWHISNLRLFFDEWEVQNILKTYTVASSSTNAAFSWIYSKTGSYSVKSGYWIWTKQNSFEAMPNLSALFEAIWKVKAPPKIQHFLWRCLNGSLAVGDHMASKKLIKDPDCPRCGTGKETINHILFECGFARLAWASSPLSFLFYPFPSPSLFTNLSPCLLPQGIDALDHQARFTSWPWLLWRLWKARNDFCINGFNEDIRRLISSAEEDARGWEIANTSASTNPTPGHTFPSNQVHPRSKDWQKPPLGKFKCNSDGSWKSDSSTSGVGWILRDDLGRTRWTGMKTYPALASPVEVEAASLAWAMNVIDNLNFSDVIFEVDCRDLYMAINQPMDHNKLRVYLDEISKRRRVLRPSFQTCTREANNSADLLAKSARCKEAYNASIDCGINTSVLPNVLLFPSVHHFVVPQNSLS